MRRRSRTVSFHLGGGGVHGPRLFGAPEGKTVVSWQSIPVSCPLMRRQQSRSGPPSRRSCTRCSRCATIAWQCQRESAQSTRRQQRLPSEGGLSMTPRLFRSITSEGQHCLFDRSSGSPTARIWRRQAPLALERPLPNSRPSNGRSSMSALLPYRSLSRSPSCRLDVSNWPAA